MYYKLNEKELELIKKIEKNTSAEYLNGEMIEIEKLISALENMQFELNCEKEKYEDLEKDLHDNYIRRPMSDYTGDSYDDRF